MGAGVSALPETLTEAEAEAACGDHWSKPDFDHLAQGGAVSRAALLDLARQRGLAEGSSTSNDAKGSSGASDDVKRFRAMSADEREAEAARVMELILQ